MPRSPAVLPARSSGRTTVLTALRTTAEERAVLVQAAHAGTGGNLSELVRSAALDRARTILAEAGTESRVAG